MACNAHMSGYIYLAYDPPERLHQKVPGIVKHAKLSKASRFIAFATGPPLELLLDEVFENVL